LRGNGRGSVPFGSTSTLGNRRRLAFLAAGTAAAFLALPSVAPADTLTFSNPTPITIPAPGSTNQQGPADPYPSTISTSGFTGPVEDVDVTIRNLGHECDRTVAVLLVGPDGNRTILMSLAGSCFGTPVPNETFTLDDEASGSLPCTSTPPVPPGSYKPTRGNCIGTPSEAFPPPAPPGPYPLTLTVFDGTSANGDWKLFVLDESAGEVGTMATGWSLTITTPSDADLVADRGLSLATNKSKTKRGKQITFSGQVDASAKEAACESGQTVELQRKKPKETAFTTFDVVATFASGHFSTDEVVKKTFEYRAHLVASADCNAVDSNTEKVKVKKPR
jgi:subtilisin-like proprotein convertase family protein